MNEPAEDKSPFTDQDLLLLQQLLTRQALSAADDGQGSTDGEPEAHRETATGADGPWRLVPPEFSPHEWQSRCLDIWLGERRGTVKVATGGGKTLFALLAAQTLQNRHDPDLRMVVIVPTIPLMYQWRDELRNSNIPKSQIALMGGGEGPGSFHGVRILIAVLNSAREKLPALITDRDWRKHLLLVVDECHRANAAEAKKIFDVGAAYTLGLSATPESDGGDDGVSSDENFAASDVGKALGPIIFEFSLKESMATGLLAQFEVWHVGLSLRSEEETRYSKLSREISELRKGLQLQHRRSRSSQGFLAWCQSAASRDKSTDASRFIGLANERKRLLYRAHERADFTLRALRAAMQDADRRAIVFHESIDEINSIFVSAVRSGLPAVLEHSKLPPSVRVGNIDTFRRGVSRVIISGKSLVEGFNVPSADIGIIAASSGSVRQRIQSLGRMLRKKHSNGKSIIFVLYIKETEDESIYEKADWEAVIGANQNRYFVWTNNTGGEQPSGDLDRLLDELQETGTAPRHYRPPCHEVDTTIIAAGDKYPGQTKGLEVRVDQSNNIRSSDGSLISAPSGFGPKVLEINPHRRAVITPCGHLISREASRREDGDEWIYVGDVQQPQIAELGNAQKLAIKQVSGRRVIVKKVGRNEVYARGVDKARDQAAGSARDALLSWIIKIEGDLSSPIRELFWDGMSSFWLEVNGQRIVYDGPTSPLEFPE
jgi:superfamily II DNA or RNA helicase